MALQGTEAAKAYEAFVKSDDAKRLAFAPNKSVGGSVKTLVIRMLDKNSPTYEFQGEWAGRDVKVVMRSIWRNYLLASRTQRRKLSLSELTVSPTTTEATNE
jgi:hypothetical protein